MATALIIILMKLVEAMGLPLDIQPETPPATRENIIMPTKVTSACVNFVKPSGMKINSNT
ncbi:hypothetical protein [Salegentibacter sediminis]|uniref:hypothetical protein n=1 Tax=Salegentibacter sediminis TaxID=1930251 RepID=UPI0009C13A7A|nr:hypothetical protein [Salegentibacter sediminis]